MSPMSSRASKGRTAELYDLLGPLSHRFTEGFDTA